MIKFFRKIRCDLIKKGPSVEASTMAGKSGRYLLYALGEIILVVAGILIALSINNANEQKKASHFELQLLFELQKTVDQQITYMESALDFHGESKAACELLVSLLQNELPQNDTISEYFNTAYTVRDVNLRFSAFENIKSYGLHFIKDEEIRDGLLYLYESQALFLETLLNRNDMYYYNTIAPEIAENYVYIDLGPEKIKGFLPTNLGDGSNNKHINMLTKTSDLLSRISNTERRMIKGFKDLNKKLSIEIANK